MHGSYQLFDHAANSSLWHLDMAQQLAFEDIRSVLKRAHSNSSAVLAAVRRDYVFIYAEVGVATLLSVRDGRTTRRVEGCSFALSDRYVLPIEVRLID